MIVKTILVIDSDRDFAEFARLTLTAEGFDVLLARDGASGLAIAEHHLIDAAIVDISLLDMNGLDVCRELRAVPVTAALPIILLTKSGNEPERVAGLDTGADDSLAMPISARELVARVKALIRRATLHEHMPSVLQLGDLTMDTSKCSVSYAGHTVDLTATEFRILVQLAAHPEKVFTREEILQNVHNDDIVVLDRCIDVHILSLRRKLDGGKEIKTVRGFGYKYSLAA